MDPRLLQVKNKLITELITAPIEQITGVVSARGGRFASELIFTLSEWRYGPHDLQHIKLTVRKLVEESEANEILRVIKPHRSVVFRAHFLAENSYGSPQALMLGSPDIGGKTKTPTSLTSEFFGRFEYDSLSGYFESNQLWGNKPVRLVIDEGSENAFKIGTMEARKIWAQQKEWHETFIVSVLDSLFDLKNDLWNDSNEPLSRAEFTRLLEIGSISVNQNGRFTVCFDEGGQLFTGHAIFVAGSVNGGIARVTFE